jgi:hypothetical protein
MLHLLDTRIEELYNLSSATVDDIYASNTCINHIREFTAHVDAENFLFECNHRCVVEDYSDPEMGAFIIIMWEA